MTYVIFVTEQDAAREVELCRVEGDPVPIVAALRNKKLLITLNGVNKRSSIPKYCSVRAEEQ